VISGVSYTVGAALEKYGEYSAGVRIIEYSMPGPRVFSNSGMQDMYISHSIIQIGRRSIISKINHTIKGGEVYSDGVGKDFFEGEKIFYYTNDGDGSFLLKKRILWPGRSHDVDACVEAYIFLPTDYKLQWLRRQVELRNERLATVSGSMTLVYYKAKSSAPVQMEVPVIVALSGNVTLDSATD
jgi:hypothetical protein